MPVCLLLLWRHMPSVHKHLLLGATYALGAHTPLHLRVTNTHRRTNASSPVTHAGWHTNASYSATRRLAHKRLFSGDTPGWRTNASTQDRHTAHTPLLWTPHARQRTYAYGTCHRRGQTTTHVVSLATGFIFNPVPPSRTQWRAPSSSALASNTASFGLRRSRAK